MESPRVKTVFEDKKRNNTYTVIAYRPLTPEEARGVVALHIFDHRSLRKKRDQTIEIKTTLGKTMR